jgi:hypothetical protein
MQRCALLARQLKSDVNKELEGDARVLKSTLFKKCNKIGSDHDELVLHLLVAPEGVTPCFSS